MSLEFEHHIVAATRDVFGTMLMLEALRGEAIRANSVSFPANVTGTLGMAGDVKGIVAIHCPEITALFVTSSLLGVEVQEINEEVRDAVGEIVNMIAGGIKAALAAEGIKISISIPTTITGQSYRVAGFAGAARLIIPFFVGVGDFWVEVRYEASGG
ncbi:MAG: hypothetical protein A2521_01515 [Deltaproteobacteria bacterium RIFOXYD12_FULL_57_12]|nr:MAG: hypothetical protein A2521_01515 [Deltaproteobacteria bacterium RIFOXYD12_FULL_57_12]